MEKITAFVFRRNRTELLLFEHEDKTIQLPAGTVERNENALMAGIRETCEEAGINSEDIIASELLEYSHNDLEAHELMVEETSEVYSRPKTTSMNWGKIPGGITVKKLREQDGFCQVQYEDWNDERIKDFLTYSLIGWIEKEHVSREKMRHYCILDVKTDRDQWSITNDHHTFSLFWSPITKLPQEIVPGNKWIKILLEYLAQDRT